MTGINQADISRKLNISRATVNRALNGHPSVSPETRELVHAFARDMGYVPSAAALTMRRKGRTEQVGLVLPDGHNSPAMLSAVTGMNMSMEKVGYLLSLVRLDDIRHLHDGRCKAFRERVLDGMIVTQINDLSMLEECRKIVPHIIWMENTRDDDFCCIRRDETGAVRDLVRFVVAKGYQRLIWYGNRPNYPEAHFSVIDRYNAFHAEAESSGVEHETLHCFELKKQQAETWKGIQLDKSTCIVTYDQRYAIRANMLIAASTGKIAGRDYGIVSCDSAESSGELFPELARLSLDMLQYGKLAAGMLLDLLHDPQNPPASRLVRPDFIAGNTL